MPLGFAVDKHDLRENATILHTKMLGNTVYQKHLNRAMGSGPNVMIMRRLNCGAALFCHWSWLEVRQLRILKIGGKLKSAAQHEIEASVLRLG